MNGTTKLRIALLCAFPLAAHALDAAKISPAETREIAANAYTFFYPLVLMELTRRAELERRAHAGLAGVNQFVHAQTFPDDHSRLVIRPNADTLYSIAWLDLAQQPMLLHVPDTHDRYYVMQLLDAWTETFDMPGKRMRGTKEQWFAIVGPAWQGVLPAHVHRIVAPTNTAWLLGRTQVNGVADYDAVHAIQSGYLLMKLSQYPNGAQLTPPAEVPGQTQNIGRSEPPPVQLQRMAAAEFFQLALTLLVQDPPHPQDAALLQQMAKIGIVQGRPFEPESLGAEGRKAIDEGAKAAADALQAAVTRSGVGERVNGWSSGFSGATGRYGIRYDARAAVARLGLGALPPEEATYFSCCQNAGEQSLSGAKNYSLHFAAGQLPPVRAFWSLTMYGEDGYFVANPIHRFAIGDRDALKLNGDGSLDLLIQHDAPGGDRDSNWLPAPSGKFNLSLRLFWPRESVIEGKWLPPAMSP
jgi:hypothetical protein